MNFISVCAGIEAASVAWSALGWKALLYAEIERAPRAVLKLRHHAIDQRRYKGDHSKPVLWGDFTALRPRHLRKLVGHADVDLLVGGTPCQSFSIAGQRAGLDDPRGHLALEYALLAYRIGVRWLLWENVPGVFSSEGGKDFAAILSAFTGRVVEVPAEGWENSGVIPQAGPGHFGIAWRVLDAQYAGVPQRRRRVFVVGYLGDWRRAAAVLFESYSLQRNHAPRREKGQTSPTIPSRRSGGGGLGTDFDCDGGCIVSTLDANYGKLRGASGQDLNHGHSHLIAYRGNNTKGPIDVATAVIAKGGSGRMDFESETFVTTAAHTTGDGFWQEGLGTLRGREQDSHENLVAFDSKRGGEAGVVSPTLRSMNHDKSHANAGGQIAVAIPETLQHNDIYASTQETDAIEILRTLREKVGTEAFAKWGSRILDSLQSPEVLRSTMYGIGIRQAASKEGLWLDDGTLPCAENLPEGSLRDLWKDGPDRCSSRGFRLAQQLSREFGAPMSKLPYENSPIQKMMQVRRLTPREAERLQGFPDDYTLVNYRGKPMADEPRYKMLGNSMAVPCMKWIGERIAMVDAIPHEVTE